MRKLKTLYNPTIDGAEYHGFLKALGEMGYNISIFDFLKNDNIDFYDNYILTKIGERKVRDFLDENNLYTYTNIYGMLMLNAYQLNGLYNSTTFVYNPIENYNMIEEEKTILGEQTNSNTIGVAHSEQTNTVNPNKNTTQDFTATFDSDDFVPTGKSEYEQNNDIKSVNVYNGSEQTNSETIGGKEDARRLTRSGNIGVTTSQMMLESERNLVRFVFADELVKVIEKNLLRMEW